ncbi:glycosyltransferase family 2 protein [Christiangramia crocea]|uniref:Glycosyltransferase family 2 protein n=1 Tax=Christiangramia crocea TaxID=2904124 RepID=A0A9X2A9L7_9FLAO|nr:glycosyltransferase family A protein [Gramella crocea]MCG9973038.1 glycosyltransferase family 2 protein [Gramella crocea]
MSSDIGGIYGESALSFKKILYNISNFEYLLSSIAKIGQQNSLFCYLNPSIFNVKQNLSLKSKAKTVDLFGFVAQHYNQQWLWILFFCYWKYEKKFPIIALGKSFFLKSFFKKKVKIKMEKEKKKFTKVDQSIDVIIPTLSRSGYIKNLLHDFANQTKLPERVIIIEQDPDPTSISKLPFLKEQWPFKIVHHFIHQTGACNARNLALKEVRSNWVLFADDDIRIEPRLLENSLKELKRLGVNCLNLNSLQPGEKTVFSKIKQWGAFGSANALVKSEYALKCKFSKYLEFGFGEDIDYGMQLRNLGCDIIYHPDLKFTHLKAKTGGFRTPGINEWKEQDLEPKPSPTMMFLIKQYYSSPMVKGFKISLFIKYYRNQKIINPFLYFRSMQKRWKLSESLCERLDTLDTTETKR